MTRKQEARVKQARAVLARLGFPRAQTGLRTGLVLLGLLELRADQPWSEARGETLWTTHALMQFMRRNYGKDYAANSRENVRRESLHQLVEAGVAVLNPDDPSRPTNSRDNCYQITPEALSMLRAHDDADFDDRVTAWFEQQPGLVEMYAQRREMARIPVALGDGQEFHLSPGGQNVLIKAMLEDFCPRFTPGGKILYIGDTGADDPVFDSEGLRDLGLILNKAGKLPDLIVYLPDKNWLVLMEAASTHGPVDGKRYGELHGIFGASTAGLVLVSCFPTREIMRKYLSVIAWETEVWCADSGDHLIHFNGSRFLGPYEPPRG